MTLHKVPGTFYKTSAVEGDIIKQEIENLGVGAEYKHFGVGFSNLMPETALSLHTLVG